MIGASKGTTTRSYQVLSTTNITSTGSQNYTVPEGTVYLEIEMWGGGAGGGAGGTQSSGGKGGGTTTYGAGGGGGAGAYVKHKLFATTVVKDAVINFTVGSGGAGSGAIGGINKGTDGGATTINNITAPGGGGVVDLSGPSAGGGIGGQSGLALTLFGTSYSDGGTAANGNMTNTNGEDGVSRPASTTSSSGVDGVDGGDAPNGGAGGSGSTVSSNPTGGAGNAPGGGGGGAASHCPGGFCSGTSPFAGGLGQRGQVTVKAYG